MSDVCADKPCGRTLWKTVSQGHPPTASACRVTRRASSTMSFVRVLLLLLFTEIIRRRLEFGGGG